MTNYEENLRNTLSIKSPIECLFLLESTLLTLRQIPIGFIKSLNTEQHKNLQQRSICKLLLIELRNHSQIFSVDELNSFGARSQTK